MSARRMLPLLAAAALAALPAAAHATPVLDEADATELAQALADATEEQGVCYGWNVDLEDDWQGDSGIDSGSNFGPDTEVDPQQCPRWVELDGSIHYTSESSESNDSSDVWIKSNLENPPTPEELYALSNPRSGGLFGMFAGDATLHGDDNDVVLFNMVSALPALTAEHGEAEPVAFETDEVTPADQQGEPSASPGSDTWRQYGALAIVAILLVVGGVGWFLARLIGFHHFTRAYAAAKREFESATESDESPERNSTWNS